jgi:glucose/mannose transport system substrate-binding protein
MSRLCAIMLAAVVWAFSTPAGADQTSAEVIHWWVSGGEATALQVVIDEFEDRGHEWVDTPVESSYPAKTAAMSRLFEGRPVTAMQWHVGPSLGDLYQEGLIHGVGDLAQQQGWRDVLPESIWRYVVVDGELVAAPLTLHGTNWCFANAAVLDRLGLAMPEDLDGFYAALEACREADIIPLAVGGQPWQVNILFIDLLLAVGGPELYEGVVVEHAPEVMAGSLVAETFRHLARLRAYTDPDSPDRSWDATAKLIAEGRAGFYLMGDWAKAEFLLAGLEPGGDIACGLAPGTAPAYLAVADAFAMVRIEDPEAGTAQRALAEVLMDPEVQARFNRIKGAIPPRLDAPVEGFDACARMAMDLVRGEGTVLPGVNMANREIVTSAMLGVVMDFWNDPAADPDAAARRLAAAVAEAAI